MIDATLSVGSGEFVVLHGPSGAGKSTCLALLSGRILSTSGEVFLAGEPRALMSKRRVAEWLRQTAFVTQNLALLEKRTVAENVRYGAEIGAQANPDSVVERLLDVFEISPVFNRRPADISGGQRQRAVLAQALAKSPRILFADEPTANLDPNLTTRIVAILNDYRQKGMTCIVSSHNIAAFRSVEARALVVEDGRLRSNGEGS